MLVRSYGVTPDGAAVDLYTLGDSTGLEAQIITYGGTIVAIEAPDRSGVRTNVVLSLPSLADYVAQDAYLGALVGRYANRIGGASFVLDGSEYHVSKNDGDNCLHGGRVGFNKAVWRVVDSADEPEPRLTLRHVSPDGDQGFPGAVTLEVTYVVSGGNTLRLEYRAETDRPTVVNLHQSRLFQLGRRGACRHPRARHDDRRGTVHAGRCRAHSDRRDARRCRHALRFPRAAPDRRPHRRAGRATRRRPRL